MNALSPPPVASPAAGASSGAAPLAAGIALRHPPGLEPTDVTRCFAAFLALHGWAGAEDDMLGALPHAEPRPDLTEMRNALSRLGFPTRPLRLRRRRLDPRMLPALLIRPGQPAALLYRDPQGGVLLFDGASGSARGCAHWHLSGVLYVPVAPEAPNPRASWIGGLARRFAGNLPILLVVSALVTLTGLAVPAFTMLVFDLVVAGRQPDVLRLLVAGVLLAVLAEVGFRALRRRALAQIGERVDRLVSTGVFSQLMGLPAALVERAGTAAQVSRLRDFAAIRDVLTGSFALALLDLPFTLAVIVLMAWLGGLIALVPVGAALAFLGLLYLSHGAVTRAVNVPGSLVARVIVPEAAVARPEPPSLAT